MIDIIYIEEAKRIREEYIENLNYITKEEDNINKLIKGLDKIKEEVSVSESKDDNYYKNKLFEVEKMINFASERIDPYYEKIKELDKKQQKLYFSIKDKYPGITDEQIAKSIVPHIVELDKKLRRKYKQ